MNIHQRKTITHKDAAEALFAKRAAPSPVAPRILEDAARPVVVETVRKRGLVKREAKQVDHAVVAAVANLVSPARTPAVMTGDHAKVAALVADGRYEEASKLAAKLINHGKADGFFVYGETEEFALVDGWFKSMVSESQTEKLCEFCELTPELAQIILARNAGNRRVHASNLAVIMRDMVSGRWTSNGETIIVSKDGELNDGQHRSFAALLTGSCVETAFAFGVDRSTIANVDTGRKRTGADRLNINKVPNYVPMSAISNLVIEMMTGRAATPAETDEFFFQHKELIEKAHAAAGSSMKGVGPSASGAASAYLISQGFKQEQVAAFFASIKSGEMMPKRDPRMVLHKAIFDSRFKIKLSRDNWVRAFVAHFIAYRDGKTKNAVEWDVVLTWSI